MSAPSKFWETLIPLVTKSQCSKVVDQLRDIGVLDPRVIAARRIQLTVDGDATTFGEMIDNKQRAGEALTENEIDSIFCLDPGESRILGMVRVERLEGIIT